MLAVGGGGGGRVFEGGLVTICGSRMGANSRGRFI